MDKVFSARLDVEVVDQLERACRLLQVTKKSFLEQAIQRRVRQVAPEVAPGGHDNIWERTWGAWKREETSQETVKRIRQIVEEDFYRHHKGKNAKLLR